jgi:hypothetical protein
MTTVKHESALSQFVLIWIKPPKNYVLRLAELHDEEWTKAASK